MELELNRRNESRCCLFSLSRNFFSALLALFLLDRNRWPVVNILTGEMLLDDGLDADEPLGSEKLRDDKTACDEVRENKLDGCRDVCVLCEGPPPALPPGELSVTERVDKRDVGVGLEVDKVNGAER